MSRYRRRLMMASQEKEEYIIFADPVVEQICATNWGDGVGITPSQAARVTDIPDTAAYFYGNTQITSFKELIYFTSLTNLRRDVFRGCSNFVTLGIPRSMASMGVFGSIIKNVYMTDLQTFLRITMNSASLCSSGARLYENDIEVTAAVFPTDMTSVPGGILSGYGNITSVTLPPLATSIGATAFRNTGITSIDIPSGVTSIGKEAFKGCSSLTGVLVIPAGCTTIGDIAFYGTNFTANKVLPTTPPTMPKNSHNFDSGNIYVPYSADHSVLNAYKTADVWSRYASKIYELNPDGTIPS